MKPFLDEDFLLTTETSKRLFHTYADVKKTPIIDYHCHIDPKEIWEDRQFNNITEVWLGGDHYKWRQLRTNGVPEKYITGDADDFEKFKMWASIMPRLIGNPLYHWSHLELKYYFGYEGNLNEDTAKEVWDLVNAKLKTKEYSVRNIIRMSNVKLICTTDDPADSLEYHKLIKEDDSFDVEVLPAWRPDNAMNIEKKEFKNYIEKLAKVSETDIHDFDSLMKALDKRMDFFASQGCKVSDHGLEFVMYEPATKEEIDGIFSKAMNGLEISRSEELKYKTEFMLAMARKYSKKNWTMQLHYGCKRDNNSLMFNNIGKDTGFDCINDYTPSKCLADFLNNLASSDELPKTIVYSLNPQDNAAIGTVIGCFQGVGLGDEMGVRNKVMQGAAWWFNDHYLGISEQLKSFASLSTLGNFVGMLTDSRSFLSYTRHEYFRRILCNMIGEWVENGEYPDAEKLLEKLVKDISYNNAISYFGFDLEMV